jgi:RimJ/RimL family protein N-acetyltransferase
LLVRIRQEVQEVPRRLAPPRPRLADEALRLEPIGARFAAQLDDLARDEDVRRFTRVPAEPRDGFGAEWGAIYDRAWDDGSRAGFAIVAQDDDAFLGLAAFVLLELDELQGEAGYVLAPAARGRGVATRALRLLTRWGFEELGLERIELRIDVDNAGSIAVAERAGYRREGVLRWLHVKDGYRADTSVWARLRSDP